MVELMSKIIRNAPAGRLGEGNQIEQKEVFVQLRGEGQGENGYFDKVILPFWICCWGRGRFLGPDPQRCCAFAFKSFPRQMKGPPREERPLSLRGFALPQGAPLPHWKNRTNP